MPGHIMFINNERISSNIIFTNNFNNKSTNNFDLFGLHIH